MANPLAPNPVVLTTPYHGWTIRHYADGLIDAEKGIALSPGFDRVVEVLAYVDGENQIAADAEQYRYVTTSELARMGGQFASARREYERRVRHEGAPIVAWAVPEDQLLGRTPDAYEVEQIHEQTVEEFDRAECEANEIASREV